MEAVVPAVFASATVEASAVPAAQRPIDMAAGTVITTRASTSASPSTPTAARLVPGSIRDAGDYPVVSPVRVADLAERTRTNKVSPDEPSGGTFTITNTGSRGARSTPRSSTSRRSRSLGTGAVVKRPSSSPTRRLGPIAVRSMVYLAPSLRPPSLVDGADAARFLVATKQRLEDGFVRGRVGPGEAAPVTGTQRTRYVVAGSSGLSGPPSWRPRSRRPPSSAWYAVPPSTLTRCLEPVAGRRGPRELGARLEGVHGRTAGAGHRGEALGREGSARSSTARADDHVPGPPRSPTPTTTRASWSRRRPAATMATPVRTPSRRTPPSARPSWPGLPGLGAVGRHGPGRPGSAPSTLDRSGHGPGRRR